MQPGALGEAGEGVGDGDVEVLGGAGGAGGSAVGGGGGKRGADFLVRLPVGFLSVAVAVARGLALGAAFEVVGRFTAAGACGGGGLGVVAVVHDHEMNCG